MKGGQIPKPHSPWLRWIHSKDSIVLHQLELLHSQFELGKDTSASASSGEFRFLIDLRVDRFLKDLCQSIRYPLLNWLCCRVIAYCVCVRRTYVFIQLAQPLSQHLAIPQSETTFGIFITEPRCSWDPVYGFWCL